MTTHQFNIHTATLSMPTHQRTSLVAMRTLLSLTFAMTVGCGTKTDTPRAADDTARDAARQSPAEGGSHAQEASAEHADEQRVTLTDAAFRTAQIEVQAVNAMATNASAEGLDVPGQVELDPRRIALVSSRTPGRVERLDAVEGDQVAAGEVVGALFSSAYLTAQVDLAQALRRVTTLAGTSDEAGARSLVEAARRRMRLLGANDADIARAANPDDAVNTLALRAPIDGSVIEAHVLPGAAVDAGAPVFTIADLSVIDVVAEVPERNLPQLRTGQRAMVGIAAFPSLKFEGRVERLRDALNPETRTLQAVIHVANASRRLRPGMFATVRLDLPAQTGGTGGATTTTLTIPESAVVTDGERRFVFVEISPRVFERREVRVAPMSPAGSRAARTTAVVVHDGLRAGERIVVRGAFILKSELAKASLGDEH